MFLVVGIGVGFAAIYPWMRLRAPEIARPLPVFTGRANPSSAPAPPPVDTARLAQLQQAVADNPRDFEALAEMGNMNFEQEKFNEAVDWYKKALEVQPGDLAVQTDMGGALFYAGRVDESIAAFNRSLELDPAHPQALFNLGVALLEGKQDVEGALKVWERLVAANPDFPQVDIVKQQIERLREQQQ